IDHRALLSKLNTSPRIRRCIRAWLEAGVVDDGELFPTDSGTPQGGALPPLFANIYLPESASKSFVNSDFPSCAIRSCPQLTQAARQAQPTTGGRCVCS